MVMNRSTLRLDTGWRFRRLDEDGSWETVCLPHSPFVADLDGQGHWHGRCAYRRKLRVEAPDEQSRYALYFGAAMHTATVYVDGVEVGSHSGGYLPFEIDVTNYVQDGAAHELLVELDNRYDPEVPPGKPFEELDFCCYGGLYRQVELRTYPSLHVTDAVEANEVASGGVFVRTLQATAEEARLVARVHARNVAGFEKAFRVRYRVRNAEGNVVAKGEVDGGRLATAAAATVEFGIRIEKPQLWSVGHPQMQEIEIELVEGGVVVDCVRQRFGIRRIEVSRSGGLVINGQRIRPRGTNRHQDYPRIGYALSDAAQRREAKRIKESGFDYVRLSHYPQSPAFLDACDELGILVMNCIPGWQFLGGEAFREACYRNARELVRRDRNHPCVVFWELSLNETEMDSEFMDTLLCIGHEEYPGDQMFVCGWQDHFDVFIHSRQHGQIHSWQNGDKPLVIAEYGDWEFYASNEGFDQKTGSGLLADSSNSRAFRGSGEGRLRQQARNHIDALNDTMASPAVCDGLWSMYDYPRGYHPTRAACGVMDIHRLPKYSYFFYRSQRSPDEGGSGWSGGPMVYVASRWSDNSYLDVLVFSNCEQVELRFNGASLGVCTADRSLAHRHLRYPPFVFRIEQFNPGRLEATGYINGEAVATHWVATSGEPASIVLSIDDDGIPGDLDTADVLLVHARIVDAAGVLCKRSSLSVDFSVTGGAEIVGPLSVVAESGVASVVARRPAGCRSFAIEATNESLGTDSCRYDVEVSDRAVPVVATR